jgi:hypothetical protein
MSFVRDGSEEEVRCVPEGKFSCMPEEISKLKKNRPAFMFSREGRALRELQEQERGN